MITKLLVAHGRILAAQRKYVLALKPTAVTCAVFACALGVVATGASAQPLQTLHSFTACLPSGECPIDNDGSHPNGAMVRGSDDNLFPQHQISVTGRGFLVDEFTVGQLVANAGSRLKFLQNLDGGWYFNVTNTDCGLGPGVSCPNTIGVTGLGLLAAYQKYGDLTLLEAAWQAGDLLVEKYEDALLLDPQGLPKLQDVEFLRALSDFSYFYEPARALTYSQTASNWFGVLVGQFTAAARVDALFASRAAGGRQAVAVWVAPR